MQQILVNLIGNGIKFSPNGSTIKLGVDTTEETITITVQDNGPGVPAEFRETIFQPFERVPERPQEGTGLGLAICQAIVLAHKGAIGMRPVAEGELADSEQPSSGSIFWIRLPLIAPQPALETTDA
jgi:two-component system sensor histidine kinase KdpD